MKKQKLFLNNENYILYFSKSILFLLFTAILLCVSVSCSDDDTKPNPDPKPVPDSTAYTLKFKSVETVEFKLIQDGVEKNTTLDNIKKYFGERLELSCPEKINFTKDSVSIIKPNGIVEKYKSKWQNDELFLYNDQSVTWEYCGKKNIGRSLLLNTGFFIKKSTNQQRVFSVVGQEYALRSYSQLMAKDNLNQSLVSLNTVWLRMEYNFVLQP